MARASQQICASVLGKLVEPVKVAPARLYHYLTLEPEMAADKMPFSIQHTRIQCKCTLDKY